MTTVAKESMDIGESALGKWVEAPELTLEPERMYAYGRASDDADPPTCSGKYAPPVFAAVPIMPAVRDLLTETTSWYRQWRGLHAGHDLVIHRPLEAGMTVQSRAKVQSVTNSTSGVLIVVGTESFESERMLNEQTLTLYFPGAVVAGQHGEAPSPYRGNKPSSHLKTVEQLTTRDQSFRYAGPSGDHGLYHLSAAAARDLGLPGIILHGLCTLSFVVHALIRTLADGHCQRLTRVATRFTNPAIPGNALVASIWPDKLKGQSDETRHGFTLESGANVVLDDGLAVFKR